MTAATVGTFSGLSHAELVAAYQACRARSAKLEGALAAMLGAAEIDCMDDKSNVWRSAMIDARAILAKESAP